jgi:SAM-dependent methyltransferase
MTHPEAFRLVLVKLTAWRIFGKSPVNFYLLLNEWIWRRLPAPVLNWRLTRYYGNWLHALVCLRNRRQQHFGTFFLRNRPALELIRRTCDQKMHGATLRVAVLGCSIGAEVYSILFVLRTARPDLKIILHAVDISEEIVTFAQSGVYSPETCAFVASSIFERLTAQEKQEMFDWDGNRATVKPWLREGITWKIGDAADPELSNVIGPQDIVAANNFLCHMAPSDAERCLRKMACLVAPGGYLFVSGVDLNVRAKVASDLGWKPLLDLIAEIHDGDRSIRDDWPWRWWGLEPIDRRRADWKTRYAAVFEALAAEESEHQSNSGSACVAFGVFRLASSGRCELSRVKDC